MRLLGRWLIFLAAFCGFTAFAVNYTGWFSGYLFYLFLFLPLLSLLVTLPPLFMTVLIVTSPKEVRRGTTVFLTVGTKRTTKVFRLPVTLWIKQENISSISPHRRQVRCRFTPNKPTEVSAEREDTNVPSVRRKKQSPTAQVQNGMIRIPIDTAHTAQIRTTLRRVRMTDPLGLFSFPVRVRGALSVETTVLPEQKTPVSFPEQWKSESAVLQPANGFSEQSEIRTYRPGDLMRSVHWKLSAKTDDVLVRQPMEYPHRTVGVTFDRTPDEDAADAIYDCLSYLLSALCRDDRTLSVQAAWCLADGTITGYTICSAEEIPDLFRRILEDRTPEKIITAEDMKNTPYLRHAAQGYHISADCTVQSYKQSQTSENTAADASSAAE